VRHKKRFGECSSKKIRMPPKSYHSATPGNLPAQRSPEPDRRIDARTCSYQPEPHVRAFPRRHSKPSDRWNWSLPWQASPCRASLCRLFSRRQPLDLALGSAVCGSRSDPRQIHKKARMPPPLQTRTTSRRLLSWRVCFSTFGRIRREIRFLSSIPILRQYLASLQPHKPKIGFLVPKQPVSYYRTSFLQKERNHEILNRIQVLFRNELDWFRGQPFASLAS
jgi:hypothetical protein